jgi:hypothetical protein
MGYADQMLAYAAKRSPSDALVAIYRKAPPMAPAFQERWNVWGGGLRRLAQHRRQYGGRFE